MILAADAHPAGPALTLVDYADAALAHEPFVEWLESAPRETWINTHVTYWPRPNGVYPERPPFDQFGGRPVVEIALFGVGRAYEEVRSVIIDRQTGEVLAMRSD